MNRMLVLAVLACGGLLALASFGPHATAAAVEAGPLAVAPAVPDIRLGDNVRLCLDRSRSGDTGWLWGVVLGVDAQHIKISSTIYEQTTLENGGAGRISRPVEQWVPMTSVLYIEKMLDGTAEPRLQP